MRVAVLLVFVAGVSGCANQGAVTDGALPPASSDGKTDGVAGKARLYKLDAVQGWLGRTEEKSTVSMAEVPTKTSLGLQAEGTAWGLSAAHPTPEILARAGSQDAPDYPINWLYQVGVIGFHKPHQSTTTWQPINCQLDGKTYNIANEMEVFPVSKTIKIMPFYGSTHVSFQAQNCGISSDEDEDYAFLPYVYESAHEDIIGGQYAYVLQLRCGDGWEDCPYSGEDF